MVSLLLLLVVVVHSSNHATDHIIHHAQTIIIHHTSMVCNWINKDHDNSIDFPILIVYSWVESLSVYIKSF